MKIGRNDPCPCGSGKKYKKCCVFNVAGSRRETSGSSIKFEVSLRERNLITLNAIADIFGFSKGVTWDNVKKNISGDQIRELYRVIGSLWPPDTDLVNLLPAPGTQLKALYLGDVKPDHVIRNVFRFSLYADEILIVDPFLNPWCIARDYNPLVEPNQYRSDTLKLIYFAALLEPWIRAGLVTLIPDPGNFDYALRKKTWDLSIERHKGWKPSDKEVVELVESGGSDVERTFWTLPREYLSTVAKKACPELTDEEVQQVLKHLEKKRKEDPIALDQSIEESGGQMLLARTGANLELALYICQITGAFPYTNVSHRWEELISVGRELPDKAKTWTPLTKAFQELDFKFLNDVDSHFACSMRTDGRLESFRSFLRRIWKAV
jgi:hypothetical protein